MEETEMNERERCGRQTLELRAYQAHVEGLHLYWDLRSKGMNATLRVQEPGWYFQDVGLYTIRFVVGEAILYHLRHNDKEMIVMDCKADYRAEAKGIIYAPLLPWFEQRWGCLEAVTSLMCEHKGWDLHKRGAREGINGWKFPMIPAITSRAKPEYDRFLVHEVEELNPMCECCGTYVYPCGHTFWYDPALPKRYYDKHTLARPPTNWGEKWVCSNKCEERYKSEKHKEFLRKVRKWQKNERELKRVRQLQKVHSKVKKRLREGGQDALKLQAKAYKQALTLPR